MKCNRAKLSRTFFVLMLQILGLALPTMGQSTWDKNKPVCIGLVTDGPWRRQTHILDAYIQETLDLTTGEFKVLFPEDKRRHGNWTLEGTERALRTLLEDDEVDMIVALGMSVSGMVPGMAPLSKPVIAPFVLDAEWLGLSFKPETSLKNFVFTAIPLTIVRDLRTFREIVYFEKVDILVARSSADVVPDLRFIEKALEGQVGFEVNLRAVGSINDALDVVANAQAVYVTPLVNLTEGEFQKLVEALIVEQVPSFTINGKEEVQVGIMATLFRQLHGKMARRAALYIQRILLGDEPERLARAMSSDMELTINMHTARSIGVSPPWQIISEANLVGLDQIEQGPSLTMGDAITQAVERNLDLKAKTVEIEEAETAIDEVQAHYLPRLEVSMTQVQLEEDRANTFQAESTLTGKATVNQLIYSDELNSQVSILKYRKDQVEADQRARLLDTAHGAATAYLNVLRAKSLERIQLQNLRLTRENLLLARAREAIGASGSSDVYRWESQLASNRQALVNAHARVENAKIQLNRLLNQPLERDFQVVEPDLKNPFGVGHYGALMDLIENPADLMAFLEFMVKEALDEAPELASIDAAVAAQKEQEDQAKRAFYMPEIGAQVAYDESLNKSGKGSVQPEMPGIDFGSDSGFSAALSLSLEVFTGGRKKAALRGARLARSRLEITREALREKVAQGVRSAGHQAAASMNGINQTRIAAEAAKKNLALIKDAYAQGMVSILELLDAQNASLNAEEQAASALYVFLENLVAMERASGRFYVLQEPGQRSAFIRRLRTYLGK